MTRRRGGGLLPLLLVLLASACGPKHLALPSGAGTPFPEFETTFRQAAAPCAEVRTMTAELAVSGRAGGTRIRGRVIAGLERPGAFRLEGVAPFGAPVFILVARAGSATLLLERDSRVLAGANPADVLAALTGVELAADDLRAVLAGCVAAAPAPSAGTSYGGGWLKVALGGATAVYLRNQSTGWRIEAGEIGGLVVEYVAFEKGMPRTIRLQGRHPPGDGQKPTDLRVGLSQVEVNGTIDPAAFTVVVPSGATPLTLAELRDMGPFGAAGR